MNSLLPQRLWSGMVILLMAVFPFSSHSQVTSPVIWSEYSEHLSQNVFALHFTATPLPGWALYSPEGNESSPAPIHVQFTFSPDYDLIGGLNVPIKKQEGYGDSVSVIQRIRVYQAMTAVRGSIDYVSCYGATCIPGAHVFRMPLLFP